MWHLGFSLPLLSRCLLYFSLFFRPFSPYLPVGLSHSFSPVFVFFGPYLEERKIVSTLMNKSVHKLSAEKKKTHKSRCTFTLVVKSRFYEYANWVTPPMMYKPHPLQLLIFEWAAFAYLDYERCWLGRFLETEVNLLSPPGS